MTQHQFWQRALAGGIGAHVDWLAACLVAGIGGALGLASKVNGQQNGNTP